MGKAYVCGERVEVSQLMREGGRKARKRRLFLDKDAGLSLVGDDAVIARLGITWARAERLSAAQRRVCVHATHS